MATTIDNDATTTTQAHEGLSAETTAHTESPMPDSASTAPATTSTTQGLSIASLVLGAASFVFGFSFIVPVAGLVLGIMALRREPTAKTLAVIGIVASALNLGWIVLAALGLALVIPFAGFLLPWMI